jgi:glycosyltransferase involved in cell wall biosynthesis
MSRRPRVLTWHVHGSYLAYLARGDYELYLPVRADRRHPYGGRTDAFDWPDSVREVAVEDVPRLDLDCVLYQSRTNYLEDRFEVLSAAQRRLPQIYLEHDPPLEHPARTAHVVDDPDVLLVHVTHFNDLMWDCGRTPTRVIRHGVAAADGIAWTGELPRGLTVVNNLYRRGRRTGPDVYDRARREVPLDLLGMGSEDGGGIGEVPLGDVPLLASRYRLFFNPIRYTSLGLAVCEAMMLGMPVVALATTEQAVALQDGVTGFVDTDVDRLIVGMRALLEDRALAAEMGAAARERARDLFDLRRFVAEWEATFLEVAGSAVAGAPRTGERVESAA